MVLTLMLLPCILPPVAAHLQTTHSPSTTAVAIDSLELVHTIKLNGVTALTGVQFTSVDVKSFGPSCSVSLFRPLYCVFLLTGFV